MTNGTTPELAAIGVRSVRTLEKNTGPPKNHLAPNFSERAAPGSIVNVTP